MNNYLDFLDLLFQSANVGVTFCRRLVEFHESDHGVGVILQNTDDGLCFVMQENRTSRFEKILVDIGHDRNIKFGA